MGLAFERRIFNGFVASPVFLRQTGTRGMRYYFQAYSPEQVETNVADQAVK